MLGCCGAQSGQTLLRHEEKQFHVNTFPASAPLFMIVAPVRRGRGIRFAGLPVETAIGVARAGHTDTAAMPAHSTPGQQTRSVAEARKTRAIGRRWIVLAVPWLRG